MNPASNPSPDRLYDLLPAFHRSRDAEQGYPLRALLRVIGEQVGVVENDIAQLYADWFIETCADWAVPYIGDLVGYTPVRAAGAPGDPATAQGRLRNDYLIPRREVANTIALRRRKGTLSALSDLIEDVGAWPGFAEEFFRRLAWTQHLNHLHLARGRTLALRDADLLERIGTPFDRSARTIDVRRVASRHRRGRYDIASVGAFVFRMKAYSVTGTQAYCLEDIGPQCYSFSVLGNDVPLYTRPQADVVPATELTLPVPIRRFAFARSDGAHPPTVSAPPEYYGAGKSIAIYAPGWSGTDATEAIAVGKIVPADLSDWSYAPVRNTVAIDPQRGRILFPSGQLPKQGVSVEYYYGFAADIGGGEYTRAVVQPTLAEMSRFDAFDLLDGAGLLVRLQQHGDPVAAYLRGKLTPAGVQQIDAGSASADTLLPAIMSALNTTLEDPGFYATERFPDSGKFSADIDALLPSSPATAAPDGGRLMRLNRLLLELALGKLIAVRFKSYRVRKGTSSTPISDALKQWKADRPRYAVVEIGDSAVYTEPVDIALGPRQTLQLRAAERTRPVLRMLDYMSDRPDAFSIGAEPGSDDRNSRFVLDGLMIAGRGLQVRGPDRVDGANAAGADLCEVVVRHCTLVPGWSLGCGCEPKRPSEPSIEMTATRATLVVEHSIIGSIEIAVDARANDPLVLRVSDSIVDATHSGRVALSAVQGQYAFAEATILRSTVLGTVKTHAIALAENSIFMGCIHVARSQQGCVRFCYVTPNSRSPRRYHCQPDLVRAQVAADNPTLAGDALAAAQAPATMRVRPVFDSTRYGNPAYCRLACDCSPEIARGADDESEMGVYHDLFQAQREISLQTRLTEYTPAGMDAGVILAN